MIYREHTTIFSVKPNVTIYDTLKPKQLIGAVTQLHLATKSLSCLIVMLPNVFLLIQPVKNAKSEFSFICPDLW